MEPREKGRRETNAATDGFFIDWAGPAGNRLAPRFFWESGRTPGRGGQLFRRFRRKRLLQPLLATKFEKRLSYNNLKSLRVSKGACTLAAGATALLANNVFSASLPPGAGGTWHWRYANTDKRGVRHSGERRNSVFRGGYWTPAFAGVTEKRRAGRYRNAEGAGGLIPLAPGDLQPLESLQKICTYYAIGCNFCTTSIVQHQFHWRNMYL
jgi:hypothetical protein